MGMVGGGKDVFIGSVHRMASNPDGHIQLVCGAFSSLIRNNECVSFDKLI